MRAQYGSPVHALATFAGKTCPPTIAKALAGSLAERMRMGATAFALQGSSLTIGTVGDVQWLPSSVAAPKKRIP